MAKESVESRRDAVGGGGGENDEMGNKESSEYKTYSINGYGREFIIGTLTEDESERIVDGEDAEDVLGDVTGNDNVIHICGPDIEEISITDENDDEIEFERFSFNMELRRCAFQ